MRQHIAELMTTALQQVIDNSDFTLEQPANIQIEHCRDKQHGDYACNLALLLAKIAHMPPRQLAEKLVAALPSSEFVASVAIAGPGFINFKLNNHAFYQLILDILKDGSDYGKSKVGGKKRIHIEYVSANPTGPLHVGHGRGAAYGASVANLLTETGHLVHREYYVNDAGRQMRILAVSIWLRYLQATDENVPLPGNAYQGDYIVDIAQALLKLKGHAYSKKAEEVLAMLPEQLDPEADKEAYIDAMIEVCQTLIGETGFAEIKRFGLENILSDIQEDLREFGVEYDEWFPESSLYDDGSFETGIELMKKEGHTYEKEGALWFKAESLGDEKDRVLIRDNGQPTYFASDVAYHLHSYLNFDEIIDVFGADHHGYIARLRALLKGAGKNPDHLRVLLVQFAVLYRGKTKVSMSTRSGEFVTLRQLREEVGNDAARFFYVMRKPEQHLDFDLDLAKSQSNENPVYYIQYAHARICSVLAKAEAQGLALSGQSHLEALSPLVDEHEKQLMVCLSRYKEVIESAALNHAPHQVAHYLQELANYFHSYYNASAFLVEDAAIRAARLTLILAIKQVLANGLKLLGVSSPEKM